MARKKRVGICHICGVLGELTFEHVPPRAAFNDRAVVNTPFEKIVNIGDLDNLENLKGPVSQKGAGSYTLCAKCNNDTGAWYGNAFVSWAYQGLRLAEHSTIAPSLYHVFHIFPLRVIKQIICMFFSANPSAFHKAQPDLVRFILNKDQKYLDPKIRLYTYFNTSGRSRQSGISGLLNIEERGHKIFSEISFPPFGYIMSMNSPPPDKRLVDISHFAQYGYNQWVDIAVNLPVLPVYTWLPGDFRSREEVVRESGIEENGI